MARFQEAGGLRSLSRSGSAGGSGSSQPASPAAALQQEAALADGAAGLAAAPVEAMAALKLGAAAGAKSRSVSVAVLRGWAHGPGE